MGIRQHRINASKAKRISTNKAMHNINKLKGYLMNVWYIPSDIAEQVARETMISFNYRYDECSISWAECKAFDIVNAIK